MSFWLPSSKDIAHERMKALSDFVAGLIRIAILGALADATMTRFFESLTAAHSNYSFQFVITSRKEVETIRSEPTNSQHTRR